MALRNRLKRMGKLVEARRLGMCRCGPRPLAYINEGEPMPPTTRCEKCGKEHCTIVIQWTKNGWWNAEQRNEDTESARNLGRRLSP